MDNAQIQRIQSLNVKANALNTERAKILGAVEASRRSLDMGLAQYNSRYGTAITVDSLQSEYETLEKQLLEQANDLEKQIAYIESGEYKNNKVSNPVTAAPIVTGSNGVEVQNTMAAPQYSPQPVTPNASLVTPVTGFGAEAINNASPVINNVPTGFNNAQAGLNVASAQNNNMGTGFNVASAQNNNVATGFNVAQAQENNVQAGFNVASAQNTNVQAGFNVAQPQPVVDTKTGSVSFGTPVAPIQQASETVAPPAWGSTPAPNADSVNSHLSNLLSQGFN